MRKQVIDQTAHFVVGLFGAYALLVLIGPTAAVTAVMLAALIREIIQHGDLHLGAGSAIDLLFFLLGSLAATRLPALDWFFRAAGL